ncbi:hypothetical protein CABS03_05486 [Colletotrichum abscissum]|uniref:Uncharacterized protein n=1 Tax=Colletotrichum abscissum TaxID=1671311 RepID=A0A9Q0B0I7_9PEZI|nr:hypothetical protein CABS02_12128 [Colletotrichum abscissum]
MDSATFALLTDGSYEIYRWALATDPIRDYNKPLFRTLGERCFEIQTGYLRIPPQFGFFSPGPCPLQGIESCFFVNLVSFSLILYLFLGISSISRVPRTFLRKTAFLPPVILVITWFLMCVVSFHVSTGLPNSY